MDGRYFMTAVIPVIPAVAGLAKVLTGDISDSAQSLANFVEGAKVGLLSTVHYSAYVGAMWFISSALRKRDKEEYIAASRGQNGGI